MSDLPGLHDLIAEAQRGCGKAAETLITQFENVIGQECARYISSLPPDVSHADLVQEVLLRVFTKLHQFNGAAEQEHTQAVFEKWLRTSARSTLSNLHRSRKAQRRSPQNGIAAFDECAVDYQQHLQPQTGVSSKLTRDEEVERLRDAMSSRLDDRTRDILNRYIVEGESFKQICEELSLSYDQVRYAFHKAQAELQKWLS